MNLGSRLLLALIAWLIYWLTPTELVALWASCLALSTTVFALRSLSSTLIAFTLLLTLLLPITLYQVDTPSLFYKVWFSPLVPLAFLYPDLNRSKGTAPNRGKENRHQLFLILSGLSTALGNGAFQVMNGLLSLSQGVSKSHLTRELRNVGPATTLATLWLILGLLIRLSNNTGIDHLSTAISWIWAPLLCLVFIQLSSRQVSFYLKGLAIGLIASAALGLIVTLINPSPSHPLIEPLVSLGSLHQAMQPGQADQFAAGGFFSPSKVRTPHVITLTRTFCSQSTPRLFRAGDSVGCIGPQPSDLGRRLSRLYEYNLYNLESLASALTKFLPNGGTCVRDRSARVHLAST